MYCKVSKESERDIHQLNEKYLVMERGAVVLCTCLKKGITSDENIYRGYSSALVPVVLFYTVWPLPIKTTTARGNA